MRIQKLGHVVLHVRNRDRSEAFYNGVLGLQVAARMEQPHRAAFFTLGNDHHCLAVIEVGDDAQPLNPKGVGIRHAAFKIGDRREHLSAAKEYLEKSGATIQKILDHKITNSIYVIDPDGFVIELYCDVSDVWKTDSAAMLTAPSVIQFAV